MSGAISLPQSAATLILARDTAQGLQVLMVKRTHRAECYAGAYVFPGGTVEPCDSAEGLGRCCDMGAKEGERFSLKLCAIRECFEEAGLLLAVGADNRTIEIETEQAVHCYADARRRMLAGAMRLADLFDRYNLRPATRELVYFSHWITPLGVAKRFDTHFFVAPAPMRQRPSIDQVETIGLVWIRPEEGIARQRRGEIKMVLPTIKTLEALACFETTAEMLDHARTPT